MLNILPEGDNSFLILLTVMALAGPGLGFLGSPQVYQRIIALRPDAPMKKAAWTAVGYTLLTDAGAVLCGIAGRHYLPNLADVESVYPDLVTQLFPTLLIGLFVAIILSAIMSTADSLLILAATTAVRDFYQKIFKPNLEEKRAILYLRIGVVVMSLTALFFASLKIRLIFWFALFGWAGIACSFCPPLILTLFWKKTNKYGVMAGASSGFLTAILWKTLSDGSIYEMIPGFFVSFVFTVVVSLLTQKWNRTI